MNNFIQECINKQYAVMNCDERKRPALDAWSKRPSKDFYSTCKNTGFYTMRMGQQENGDYIIGLDFDIMGKTKSGKYKKNVITERLLEEWKELNEESHGLYMSSTQNNMGNLVNITNCEELIGIIADIGKSKFENKKSKQTLEILCSSLCILPPSKTICKVAKKSITARTFLNDEHTILMLEPNTEQYKFILNYCLEYKSKSCGKTRMRDLRSKSKKEIYENVSNGKYNVKSIEHGVELLSLLNDDRYCYDNWWKIGVACMNSFDREFAEELFVQWSEKDPSGNFDGDIPFDNWCETDWDGLNWGWIMKLIEFDSPSKFIPCIQDFQRKQTAEKYEEYKKYFEETYHFCKDPQVFFYKSLKGRYIQKSMNDIRELEKHNEEYFKEWCSDENRKIYEISDSVPVKHIKDPKIFNTFRGYDWWQWENDWFQNSIDSTDDLKTDTLGWFEEYLWNLCGKNMEFVTYLKCILGNVLFNPTNPTKVIVIFQGVEGTGKSFLMNIVKRLLGGLNVAESACPQKELFGNFNEPLLTAQVVSLDENNPKAMEAILDELKNKVTNECFNVNCKNEKNFVRTNTLQWFGFMNKLCNFPITTTNRRFNLVKTSMDLAIKNEKNSMFWSKGYNQILENVECLKYIAMDIKQTYLENDGFNMDFALARPKTKLQIQIVNNAIPPIFTYLQHLISQPNKLLIQYEEDENKPKYFSQWYAKNFIKDKDSFFPLSKKVLNKLKQMKVIHNRANGFWLIKMSVFRKNLNTYINETLDKKDIQYSSDDIQTELSNFFECEKEHFDKINFGGKYQYVFNPKYTKEQLKKFKYYVIENEDCENAKDDGIDFDIYAVDGDDDYASEEEEEEEEENIEVKPNVIIQPKKNNKLDLLNIPLKYDREHYEEDKQLINAKYKPLPYNKKEINGIHVIDAWNLYGNILKEKYGKCKCEKFQGSSNGMCITCCGDTK